MLATARPSCFVLLVFYIEQLWLPHSINELVTTQSMKSRTGHDELITYQSVI